jgi:hypothetical protein
MFTRPYGGARVDMRQCGTSQPCQGCIKRTGSATMAAQICIRESSSTDLSVTECMLLRNPNTDSKLMLQFMVAHPGQE